MEDEYDGDLKLLRVLVGVVPLEFEFVVVCSGIGGGCWFGAKFVDTIPFIKPMIGGFW